MAGNGPKGGAEVRLSKVAEPDAAPGIWHRVCCRTDGERLNLASLALRG